MCTIQWHRNVRHVLLWLKASAFSSGSILKSFISSHRNTLQDNISIQLSASRWHLGQVILWKFFSLCECATWNRLPQMLDIFSLFPVRRGVTERLLYWVSETWVHLPIVPWTSYGTLGTSFAFLWPHFSSV